MRLFILTPMLLLAAVLTAQDGNVRDVQTPAPKKPSFYSLYAFPSEYSTFADEVNKVGFTWLRINGTLNDPNQERGILKAAQAGITCVPVMMYGAVPAVTHRDDARVYDEFRAGVRAFVGRYCDGGSLWSENPTIHPRPFEYIEIWNEPNIHYLKPPKGEKQDECYAKLLTIAYEEIKKLNPQIKVIGMNTSGGVTKYFGGSYPWFEFIKDVHRRGAGASYDILGTHPYTKNQPPETAGFLEALANVRAECAAHAGGEKPIWITEVGYSMPMPGANEAAIEGFVKTEDDQANYITRYLALAAANGIGQFQIMYVSDIHNYRAGLFDRAKKWRKQAYAIKTMIEVLPDPVLIKKLSEGTDGVFAYVFTGAQNRETIMAWTTNDQAVEKEFVLAGAGQTLVARDGDQKALVAVDGKVKVALTQSPVYLYAAAP